MSVTRSDSKNVIQTVINILVTALIVGYPLIIYLGLEMLPLKQVAGFILATFVLRLLFVGRSRLHFLKPMTIPVTLCGVSLALAALVMDSQQTLYFYPVLVNLISLAVFVWSLYSPPSIIECFARLTDDSLPDSAISYTRTVTLIWCFFFVVNGSIAFYTAMLGDQQIWALYNGLLSYILMGILMVSERLYRTWVIKK